MLNIPLTYPLPDFTLEHNADITEDMAGATNTHYTADVAHVFTLPDPDEVGPSQAIRIDQITDTATIMLADVCIDTIAEGTTRIYLTLPVFGHVEWCKMDQLTQTVYLITEITGSGTPQNMVTTNTNQTIGGNKTFSNAIKIPDGVDDEDAATVGQLAAISAYGSTNPSTTTNLGRDTKYVNTATGELFVCIDETTDANVWVGQLGTYVGTVVPPKLHFPSGFPIGIKDNATTAFTFACGEPTENPISHYRVTNISIPGISVVDAQVAAGEPHQFVVDEFDEETAFTFTLEAYDAIGDCYSVPMQISSHVFLRLAKETFDALKDNSAVALYRFDDNTLDDGGANDISKTYKITYVSGKFGKGITTDSSIGYAEMPEIISTNKFCVSGYFTWSKVDDRFACGFDKYGLQLKNDILAFCVKDKYTFGITIDGKLDTQVHIIAIFDDTDVRDCKLYINGTRQTLAAIADGGNEPVGRDTNIDHVFRFFGVASGWQRTDAGTWDHVRIINRDITDEEALYLASEL